MAKYIFRFLPYLPYIITAGIFFIPFFWFRPGEMDLGGDSSRLYFYDPVAYLFNHTLWGISPSNLGVENISYYILPFNLLLVLLKSFLSSTILIQLFHGIALASSFLFVTLTIKTLIEESGKIKDRIAISLSSVTGGIIYVFSPAPIMGWDKVIVTHDQVFLNPLIFYLLLKYFLSRNILYGFVALLITFLFSHNFSFSASPPFFSFYPIALLFLLVLTVFAKKVKVDVKEFVLLLILFIGLQSFHIIPQIWNILNPSSASSATIFSDQSKFDRGLNYFISVAPNIKVAYSFLNLPQMTELSKYSWMFVILPVITISGLIFTRSKVHILTALFFLFTFFLVTANITTLGYEIYRKLFIIPGFSMFRNFFGQFAYVFLFFYSLLFAQSLFVIFTKISKYLQLLLAFIIVCIFVTSAHPFITGEYVNKTLWQTKDIKIFMKFDPTYTDALSYVRSLPEGGKILTLPLTDPGYQIVMGTNNGAYQGPSTIAYLAGRKDFSGVDEFGQFRENFVTLSKNKDYQGIRNLLGVLNIQYIFYNSDPKVYEENFPSFPYIEVRKVLPQTQEEYRDFISSLGLVEKKQIGKIIIYELHTGPKKNVILPQKVVPVSSGEIEWNYFTSAYDFLKDNMVIIPADKIAINPTLVNVPSINFSDTIVKDYPIEVIYPFVRWKVGSLPYNVVLYQEEKAKKNSVNPYEKISLHLLLASKRVSELDNWGNEMEVLNLGENKRGIWREGEKFTLASWEESLRRYYKEMDAARDLVLDQKTDTVTKVVMNNKILQTLKIQKSKMYQLALKTDDHKYLQDVIDGLFEELYEGLYIAQNEVFQYSVDGVTKEKMLEIKLSYDRELDDLIAESFISYGDTKKSPESIDVNRRVVSYGKVLFNEKDKIINLSVPEKVLDKSMLWRRDSNGNFKRVMIGSQEIYEFSGNEKQDISKSFVNWESNNRYKISFDYLTQGKTYEFSLGPQVKNDTNKKLSLPQPIFYESRNSRSWTNFTVIVDSANSKAAQFRITNKSGKSGSIQMKNFKLTKVYKQPSMMLAEDVVVKDIAAPSYVEKMVNPTKYLMTIDKSDESIYVVLPQIFNKNWKVYTLDDEAMWTLNRNSLDEKNHFIANGYANGWKIPASNKKQTLIIEFIPQRIFYIGAGISIITIVIILFLLGREIKKKR